jgi:hypothetical protein
MPDHTVKLHYRPNPSPNRKPIFTPEPNPIQVRRGQTIAFQKADDSVPGKIKITFRNPEIFSTASTDGSREVSVTGLPLVTTYHCQLLGPNDEPLAESEENQGGDIEPANPPSA